MGIFKIKCVLICVVLISVSEIFAQPQKEKTYEPTVRLQSLEIPQGWTEKQMFDVLCQALAEYSACKMPGCDVSNKGKISWRVKTYMLPLPRKRKLRPGEKEIMCERIGPQQDGLMFTLSYSPKAAPSQLDRPFLSKKRFGSPWYTYFGLVDIKGGKYEIPFNLSYGANTDRKLLKYFIEPQDWLQLAKEYSNTPHKNPAAPPADRALADFSIEELLLYFKGQKDELSADKIKIVDKKLYEMGDRFLAPYAEAWFIWKTRDIKDSLALREKLANIIEQRIIAISKNPKASLHDHAYLVDLLPSINAQKQINRIAQKYLVEMKCHDCCFAPSIIEAWGSVISVDDLPKMIKTSGNGGDGWPGCVNDELEKITGRKVTLINGKLDRQAWLKIVDELKEKKAENENE